MPLLHHGSCLPAPNQRLSVDSAETLRHARPAVHASCSIAIQRCGRLWASGSQIHITLQTLPRFIAPVLHSELSMQSFKSGMLEDMPDGWTQQPTSDQDLDCRLQSMLLVPRRDCRNQLAPYHTQHSTLTVQAGRNSRAPQAQQS